MIFIYRFYKKFIKKSCNLTAKKYKFLKIFEKSIYFTLDKTLNFLYKNVFKYKWEKF